QHVRQVLIRVDVIMALQENPKSKEFRGVYRADHRFANQRNLNPNREHFIDGVLRRIRRKKTLGYLLISVPKCRVLQDSPVNFYKSSDGGLIFFIDGRIRPISLEQGP